jgi:hypothetical protein
MQDKISRGRLLLLAQRSGPPLGPPPPWLSEAAVGIWHELVAAAPDVLRMHDELGLASLCPDIVRWRAGYRQPGLLRDLYRFMGRCFIPMAERRRLLFPDRPVKAARIEP